MIEKNLFKFKFWKTSSLALQNYKHLKILSM